MSRREQIEMSPAEVQRFLAEQRTLTCATHGPRGWPHLMPLWYVIRKAEDGDPQLWSWTYAASQKVRNLERDRRATVQVQAGETYDQLRGVMLECDVILHRDFDTVPGLGSEIFARYASPPRDPMAAEVDSALDPVRSPTLEPQVATMVRSQAAKRVALQFVQRRCASWDHRKLRGIY
jgi:general stress protein 26